MVVAAARPAKVTIATSLGPVLAKLDGVVAGACVGAGDCAAGAVGVAGEVGDVCAEPVAAELLPLPFVAVFEPPLLPVTGFGAVELSGVPPSVRREMPLGLLGGVLTFGLPI